MSYNRTALDTGYHHLLSLTTRLVVERVLGAAYVSRARWIDDWWTRSEAERTAWRAEALRSTLAYAARHVPAYAELPADGAIDLSAVPTVDKQAIFGNETKFLSDERADLPAIPKHTGGSTGDPWNYPLDRRAWAEAYAVQIHRFARLGFHYGDRRVTLGFPTSHGLEGIGLQKRLRLRAERTDVSLCGFEVDPETSLERAVRASAMNAGLWYGYASTLAAMAAVALDRGVEIEGPPLIVTMAEPLWPSWRDDITTAFGSKVVEEYGCNDGGIMAHRCDEGNLHLADHQSIVEVLDEQERPCPPGVDGDVVITNFHARHMPFIRYRVGDVGALGPDHCACGTPGHTLARVAGRSGDFVLLPDGTELVPATFFNPFNEATGVRRWQMVQPDRAHLVIRVEPRPHWSATDEEIIRSWVEQMTNHTLAVRITTDEPLEMTSGGKHKVIIRQID